MKYIILIFIILLLITGCRTIPEPIYITEYETVIETITETVIVEKTIVDNTEIDRLNEELEQYKLLLSRLNKLVSCVYYMEYSNSEYENWGTGFSIKYNGKYYILTSGHYIHNLKTNYGIFDNFRFKVDDKWIYPELLDYKTSVINPDYAIFYSDKINRGLGVNRNNTEPNFRLGTIDNDLNIIRQNNTWGTGGECGSPIIGLDGLVIGIHGGYLTDIDIVLEVIDYLE